MNKSGALSIFRNSWMILALLIITAILLSTNWYYYTKTKEHLDNEFGIRLQSVASLVSSNLEASLFQFNTDPFYVTLPDTVVSILKKIQSAYSISNILVLREDGITIFSLNSYLIPSNDQYPMWNMDYKAIVRALEGTSSSTNLYKSPGGTYMKAGYAPIATPGEPSEFVVTVEANAAFLKSLQDIKSLLVIITAISIIGIILFISFVLKATGALIKARESLMRSETLATVGRMTAGIAHEIRNPLFIIRSSAEKLRETNPEQASEIDEFIIEEVDRLNTTLTEYLLFSKDKKAVKQPLDLIKVLNKSLHLVNKGLEQNKPTVKTNFLTDSAPFVGGEKQLIQSFLNILINAIQATSENGKIEILFKNLADEYIIEFTDNGGGIPAKTIAKIFEPFYTTKATGSGLGLAIVKKTIEAHNGKIDVRSKINSGTTVTINLPKNRPEPGEIDE
ncbi:hypothetical protein J7M07_02460 [bacterium]|nr:hypothetical protein [bacterium]